MSEPLSSLSPAKQNARLSPSPTKLDFLFKPSLDAITSPYNMSSLPTDTSNPLQNASNRPLSPPAQSTQPSSPRKPLSPVKYRLQDEFTAANSPPGSPAQSTVRFNEGLTRAIDTMRQDVDAEDEGSTGAIDTMQEDVDGEDDVLNESILQYALDDTISTSPDRNFDGRENTDTAPMGVVMEERTIHEDTMGDLSTISAIPTDTTKFANLRTSPVKSQQDAWSPSKQLRTSMVASTPGTVQRPLRLLSMSRRSTSSNEEEEATPRRSNTFNDSPADLLNFTGQTNILLPPPSTSRPIRRSPSGRGGFPIKVNPSTVHRSQASVDRERATGRSPQKQHEAVFPDRTVPSTPAGHRHSMYGTASGLGMDLLDIDLEPMATPRSIPTITPRELETLRSELQSRISGLEATLSGKEAEVMALKRSITDAEVRVGKTSEELHNERAAREELEHTKEDLERRTREMEEVLREVKQNIFLEEREKEKLRKQVDEADRKAEEQEVRILELQASLDTLRSERVKCTASPEKSNTPATPGMSGDIDFAVKDATEKVARELHALYKTKHERKVADLKVSYEKRWVKQVEQLRGDLKASQDEVVRLADGERSNNERGHPRTERSIP